ncbi:MAG: flagellar basal body-associated protein FliL [Burkholderiaceae bacterium]|nr:flagellar basal body-associated protein FliL [Burkholderiaceae bacterium]
MATAPKAAPKAVSKQAAPEVAEAPAPKKSKTKLIIIIAAAVVIVAGAAGGAFVFLHNSAAPATADGKKPAKTEPAKAPVFVTLEPFTVNLQPGENGTDQFLQVALTLQVPNAEQEEKVKNFMPQVRSRLLLLLSSKKASELTSVDGKKKLSDDIIATVNQPFAEKGEPQEVSAVFFTSFVIQ